MKTRILLAGAVVLAAMASTNEAQAIHPFGGRLAHPIARLRTTTDQAAQGYAESIPWHGAHYHTMWGQPVALVVPPTVEYQTNYSWGVPATRVEPIYHQFNRNYPGAYYGGNGFYPTPAWPSDTNQFGVYYVRGPWR